MKEEEVKTPVTITKDLPKKDVPEIKMRSERRAAKVASSKIADTAKYLASSKIIATTALPPPPIPRRKAQAKPGSKPPHPNQYTYRSSPGTAKQSSSATARQSSSGTARQSSSGTARQSSSGTARQLAPHISTTHSLPRMPILVFNSVPTIIPIPSSSLGQNSIMTISPSVARTPLKSSTIEKLQIKKPISTSSQPSSKFLKYNSITRQNIGLSMECEEETLSPVQWAKYRKAESDYLDVLRKLTNWKSRTDVEIIYLGADDPVPPPPRFLSVQEASRQPLTSTSDRLKSSQEVFVESDSVPMQVDEQFQGSTGKDSITATSPTKLIGNPPVCLVAAPTIRLQTGQTTTTTTTAGSTALKKSPVTYSNAGVGGGGGGGSIARVLNETVKSLLLKKKDPDSVTSAAVIDLLKHPELAVKLIPKSFTTDTSLINKKLELDAFLKRLTKNGKLAVEKWMMEKGLFGGHRTCMTHTNVQMKLMLMMTVAGTNNGYKWWCPSCAVMVPVDHGSFFSKFKEDHSVIMRVIYHWACNSDIKQVIQEVLGNKEFVCLVYTALRTICTKQSGSWRVGGAGHEVEVGELKFGSCKGTPNINLYCAYDRSTREVKVGAASYTSNNKDRITHLLSEFIDKESDLVGDKSLWTIFPPHFRVNFSPSSNERINTNTTEYLADFVLPIFRDTKDFLKLDSIQALLHELTWREKYGRDPLNAFNSIVTHIKQVCFSSVVTTQSVNSVPIALASGLTVVDTTELTKDLPSFSDKLNVGELLSTTKKVDVESKTCTNSAVKIKLSSSIAKRSSMSSSNTSKKAKTSPSPTEYLKVSVTAPSIRVPLESYYYATKTGVAAVDQQQATGKFKFKCQACKKSLEDNTKMMKHLMGHINALKQFNLDLSDLTHCKYCFREFASPYAMQSHVEEVHVNEPVTPVCRICDKEFGSIALLCDHMKLLHKESEMPYKCRVCKYRTSFYRDLIDHFQKDHDKTDKLMCNYCLRVFPIRFGEGIQEGHTYSFYRHLFKHQSKTHNRRCQSCCLAFLSNTELKHHRRNDHCSFNNIEGVKPVSVSSTTKPVYIDIEGFTAVGTETKEERPLLCVECKLPINKANHFVNNLGCSLCSFKTSCYRGYADHAIQFHSNPPQLRPPRSFNTIEEMRCTCGFLSRCGDKMAKHLSKCYNKWCHFTGNDYDDDDNDPLDVTACLELTTATEYDVDSHSDTNKEEEEKSKRNDTVRNDDQHNMMNVLGLMRVNPQRAASGGRLSSDSRPSSITRSTSSDNSTDQ